MGSETDETTVDSGAALPASKRGAVDGGRRCRGPHAALSAGHYSKRREAEAALIEPGSAAVAVGGAAAQPSVDTAHVKVAPWDRRSAGGCGIVRVTISTRAGKQ